MRWAAHNGEINTVRGNKNWMRAREGNLQSSRFADELDLLYPIIETGGSDSAAFDNVLELLTVNNVVTLPEAIMMLVPEAWQNNPAMEPEKAAFYQWAACLMEPWDGPALFAFSDGRYCGANLDRNGLRPCRWITTTDDLMICASEVGTIYVEPEKVTRKGRLQPGKMLLVDTVEGRIIDDAELKMRSAKRQPFANWLESQMLRLPDIMEKERAKGVSLALTLDDHSISTDPKLLSFGYTFEQLDLLLRPIVNGESLRRVRMIETSTDAVLPHRW
jgi:glutamate synthase (NADPH/NADH)